MIRFERAKKPKHFQDKVRKPGLAWLKTHPDAVRPRDYWSRCRRDLARAFRDLCAYSTMWTPNGTVDHFRSWSRCRKDGRPQGAYDWDNLRYCAGWINSSKGDCDDHLLDPFEVGEDWFEIILPSLLLRLTGRVPQEHRARAQATLDRLHLVRDPRVMDQRVAWLEMYESGLPLEELENRAPLIARAIRKRDAAQEDARPEV